MELVSSLGGVIADRTRQIVGVLLGAGAGAHFWFWTRGAGGQSFSREASAGDFGAAAPEALSYAASHPAYVLAFLAGAVLLVRRT